MTGLVTNLKVVQRCAVAVNPLEFSDNPRVKYTFTQNMNAYILSEHQRLETVRNLVATSPTNHEPLHKENSSVGSIELVIVGGYSVQQVASSASRRSRVPLMPASSFSHSFSQRPLLFSLANLLAAVPLKHVNDIHDDIMRLKR